MPVRSSVSHNRSGQLFCWLMEIKMKPSFHTLKRNHYSADQDNKNYISPDKLFAEVGYDYDSLLKQDPDYKNTCATRMSLAFLKSNVHFHGRLVIKSGRYKGKMIEAGA